MPVSFDPVMPPLGFGELQAIDLKRWKGNPSDPYFLDLVAACRAKLDGAPAGSQGPAGSLRLYRRVRAGAGRGFSGTGLIWALGANVGGVQGAICNMPSQAKPPVPDTCGGIWTSADGPLMTNAPSRGKPRRAGSCTDLRAHVARFPNGAYRRLAADLITAETVQRAADWSPAPRTARGYVRQSLQTFATLAAAQADARTRAQADAATLCAPLDANERLAGADVTPTAFDCRPGLGGGAMCAQASITRATCRIERRSLVEHCGS